MMWKSNIDMLIPSVIANFNFNTCSWNLCIQVIFYAIFAQK